MCRSLSISNELSNYFSQLQVGTAISLRSTRRAVSFSLLSLPLLRKGFYYCFTIFFTAALLLTWCCFNTVRAVWFSLLSLPLLRKRFYRCFTFFFAAAAAAALLLTCYAAALLLCLLL
jgi:hypothetical protein